jgi:hypothetical protein
VPEDELFSVRYWYTLVVNFRRFFVPRCAHL